MKIRLSIVAAILVLDAAPARADTLQVPGDASTIQGAIIAAADGDTILVAPGTYVESIDLLGRQLVIESTGGAAVTTIDGNQADSCVTVDMSEAAGTTLRGFTITGGAGRQVTGAEGWGTVVGGGGVFVGMGAHLDLDQCTITGNVVSSTSPTRGAGVLAFASTVSLTDCTLSGNAADRGAAIASFSDGCTVSMSGCTVTGNTAGTTSSSAVMDFVESSGIIEDCIVTDNVGSGMWRTWYAMTVRNCLFRGNTRWGYRHYGPEGGDISDCQFLGNGLGGAALLAPQFFISTHFAERCVFAEGDILSASGSIGTHVAITSCSFDGTHAEINTNSLVFVRNCIFRNSSSVLLGNFGETTVTYSDIEGGWIGDGNIDADPLWVDAASHDYRLLPASPCIDTGDRASALDPDGTPADMGAIAFENAFTDLGGGVPGTAGAVQLAAHSTLIGGEGVVFKLSGTTPFKSTVMILDASALGAPFKGGTMWPELNAVIPGLVTNGTGQLTLSTTWPAAIPSGFSLWAQFWHPDAGAVYGFAGSNGVRGTTP